MLLKTNGIVIHALKYGDTSLIVKIFTQQMGLKTFLVKGARSKKSGLMASLFQPLTILELDINVRKTATSFDSIKDARCIYPLQGIQTNFNKQAIALFIAEVLYKTIADDNTHHELHDFMEHMLLYMNESALLPSCFPHYFLVHYSKYLGLYPGGERNEESAFFDMREGIFSPVREWHADFMEEEESRSLKKLLDTPLGLLSEIHLNNLQRHNLLNALLHYYQIHLLNLREIKSHAVLAEVMRG